LLGPEVRSAVPFREPEQVPEECSVRRSFAFRTSLVVCASFTALRVSENQLTGAERDAVTLVEHLMREAGTR
jgi:hypothetical protein